MDKEDLENLRDFDIQIHDVRSTLLELFYRASAIDELIKELEKVRNREDIYKKAVQSLGEDGEHWLVEVHDCSCAVIANKALKIASEVK